MADRTLTTTSEVPNVSPAAAIPAVESTAPTPIPGLGRGAKKDARVLRRMTNGHLPRAGSTLRQLQRRFGNHYVQRLVVQAKMVLGPVDDPYEREADRAAAHITQPTGDQEPVVPQQVQGGAGATLSADVESAINQARTGGQALPQGVQQHMSQALSADFSQVRVHTDTQADQLNDALEARAFTTGTDIFFRRGEYNPGSGSGQQTLAHELTHVIQQGADNSHQRVSRMSEATAKKHLLKESSKNERYTQLVKKGNIDLFKDWLKDTKGHPLDEILDREKTKLLQYADEYLEYLDVQAKAEKEKAEKMRASEELAAAVTAEKVVELLDEKKDDAAINLMRTHLGQMKDHERQAFMAKLPPKYHGLALSSALGESEGSYALGWKAPMALEQSIAVKPKSEKGDFRPEVRVEMKRSQFAKWLYDDGPQPKFANCWEAVFVAGYRVGKLSKDGIKQLVGYKEGSRTRGPQGLIDYLKTNGQNYRSQAVEADQKGFRSAKKRFEQAVIALEPSMPETGVELEEARTGLKKYNISDVEAEAIAKQLNPGDVLMFGDSGEHFGISLGGDRLMECDGSGAPTDVRIATLKSTINRNEQYSRSIWWASPEKLFNDLKADPV